MTPFAQMLRCADRVHNGQVWAGAGRDALGQLLVGHWLMHAALERLWPALPPLQGLVVPDGQECHNGQVWARAGGDALGQLLVGHWLMHAALERLWPALPPLQGLVVPDGQELQQALRC